jgi:aspartyl-tRNA(Asn)/glutamyl-tRNA(Gln) amidotransferase subunit B
MKKNKPTYFPTIGIECHVQLKTKTKLFAAVNISDTDDQPNSATSHICFGMPGALPVLNSEAINLAIKAAFALNIEPQKFSKFDRKHYFYPDLPKGYQITQFEQPIILGGSVKIQADDGYKIIKLTRAHLEEDAGKTIHPPGKDYSLVDLNRAGVPLLEIVSEPEMHSPQEARAYARELNLIMKYSGISNADMYMGNMRFDLNVSVSGETDKLGTRSEVKNLNSFRSVEKAAEYEIKRQIELLEKGKKVVQETRGWDDAKQKTFSQRSKEDAHDYRYFPEPDVPPVILDQKIVDEIKKSMPNSVDYIREKLQSLNLENSAVETILDQVRLGKFMIKIIDTEVPSICQKIANWLSTDIQGYVSERLYDWDSLKLNEKSFIELAKMTESNQISSTSAKLIIKEILSKDEDPFEIAQKLKLIQVSGEDDLLPIVEKVINDNPQAVIDLRSGELKALGYLVGQIMKESKGKANPNVSQKIIKDQLGI